MGVALREVLTRQFPHYADNPETAKIERSGQGGLESVTNIDLKLAENMLFTSAIELFDPFSRLDEVAVRNNNTLTIKASSGHGHHEPAADSGEAHHAAHPLKESLAIGLSYVYLMQGLHGSMGFRANGHHTRNRDSRLQVLPAKRNPPG